MLRMWFLLPVFLSLAVAGGLGAAPAGYLLVANKGDRTLSIIDPESGLQIAAVPEGGVTGHEVAASPDGRTAYVPIFGNSGVGKPGSDGANMVVIDIASRKVTGNLDFGRGVRPHGAHFGPKDGLLYVTTELDESVTVVDPRTLKIVGSIPTGQPESHMLAITRDGKRGYTSNVGPGSVSVLDLEARKLVTIIKVTRDSQRIALSADDKLAFTSDQLSPRLAVIDIATNKVRQWIPLEAPGYGAAATGDGRRLILALPNANRVAVIDLHSMAVERSIDVPSAPQEVLIRPDQRIAYVSCDASHQVAEIDLSTWKVNRLIEAGRAADGLAWAPAR